MENHPIPQDVTGFQFKLIGSMTVKQFVYVAIGVIAAVILYYAPINFLIKIIFIPIFGASGVIIAFLPVEGRPVDVMVGNFFKAIFAPNQFIYQKTGISLNFSAAAPVQTRAAHSTTSSTSPSKQKQLQALLSSSQVMRQNKVDEKEEAFLKTVVFPLLTPAIPAPTVSTVHDFAPKPQVPTPTPTPAQPIPLNHTALLEQQHAQITKENVSNAPHAASVEQQMHSLNMQKQDLEKQLLQLQNQKPQQPQPLVQPQQYVHNISKDQIKNVGLPYAYDTPNVVVGIVKDSRGNVLPGMLVEIKDKNGAPVRAFKTNQLGQFASATPLSSGAYTIVIEDPKKLHSFDVIQLTTSNQILLPFEIISHDAREALRKELFN